LFFGITDIGGSAVIDDGSLDPATPGLGVVLPPSVLDRGAGLGQRSPNAMAGTSIQDLHTTLTDDAYQELAPAIGSMIVHVDGRRSLLSDETEGASPEDHVTFDLKVHLDDNALLELVGASLFPPDDSEPLVGLVAIEQALTDLVTGEVELCEVAQTEDGTLALVFGSDGTASLFVVVDAWRVGTWEELPAAAGTASEAVLRLAPSDGEDLARFDGTEIRILDCTSPHEDRDQVVVDLRLYLADHTLLELSGAELFAADLQPLEPNELEALTAELFERDDLVIRQVATVEGVGNPALVVGTRDEARMVIVVYVYEVGEWREGPDA